MKKITTFILAVFFSIAMLAGCGNSDPAQKQGEIYSDCYPDKTCNEGLTCDTEHNVCIKDESSETGDTTEPDTAPDAEDSGDADPDDIGNTAPDDDTEKTNRNECSPDNFYKCNDGKSYYCAYDDENMYFYWMISEDCILSDCIASTGVCGCKTDGTKRCDGDTLRVCSDSRWQIQEECRGGCDSSANECKPSEDPDSGLTWSSRALKTMMWADAVNYCDDLVEGGFSDWRLPTISELRTLIQNCPISEPGGDCAVTDDCLNSLCWALVGEKGYFCNAACSHDENGKYSKFGDEDWFWSSSVKPENSNYAWGIDFDEARFSTYNKDEGYFGGGNVRCVRKVNDSCKPNDGKLPECGPTTYTCHDSSSSLIWSIKADNEMEWQAAADYCANLTEEELSGWRLPSIDELRTLILECGETMTGGVCGVTESCLEKSCGEQNCSCPVYSGKEYCKLAEKDKLWSSSEVSDDPNSFWFVSFSSGSISYPYISSDLVYKKVRCVKNDDILNTLGSVEGLPECSPTSSVPCIDPKTCKIWSAKAPAKMFWQNAVDYCKDLTEGGFIDWRMPTINELRTLVQSCPGTVTDGSCKVKDTCLTTSCHTQSACKSCSSDSNGGHSKFGETDWFWSFTTSENSYQRWGVNFLNAAITGGFTGNEEHYFRCVR